MRARSVNGIWSIGKQQDCRWAAPHLSGSSAQRHSMDAFLEIVAEVSSREPKKQQSCEEAVTGGTYAGSALSKRLICRSSTEEESFVTEKRRPRN
jgi:hypothetical protein